MAEAFRSQDYFLNASTGVFKDNTAGDITAQMLRDFLYSTYRPQMLNGFRLTTESGVAVSTSDRTSQGTIYLTPYLHNCIGLFDGTSWKTLQSAQVSLALTVTSGSNYDVFAYDNSGTLTLELSNAWTNATTRADALTTQDGVLVKDGATTRRYLGTIRASGSNVTEDSAGGTTTQVGGKRFVWNACNQVPRMLKVFEGTDSWTYDTATIRMLNGATAPLNCVEFVMGVAGILVVAEQTIIMNNNSGGQGITAIGIDSTTAFFEAPNLSNYNANTDTRTLAFSSNIKANPGIGYHYISWLERGVSATCTRYGDGGAPTLNQSKMEAIIWG